MKMLHRLALLAAVAGCGSPPAEHQPVYTPATATRAEDRPEIRIRAAPLGDRLIDATFDLESRGGRPARTPPPSIEGGIRLTLETLTPRARRCFAEALIPSVAVRFTVTPTGRATDVRVESIEKAARNCLARAIGDAVYPMSPHGRAWRVQYLFRL